MEVVVVTVLLLLPTLLDGTPRRTFLIVMVIGFCFFCTEVTPSSTSLFSTFSTVELGSSVEASSVLLVFSEIEKV